MPNSKIKNKNHVYQKKKQKTKKQKPWTPRYVYLNIDLPDRNPTAVATATTSSPNLDHHLKQLGKLKVVFMMWWLLRSMTMMMIIRCELLLIMVENFWWWEMMVIVNFLAVEVTMTITGCAFQHVECTFFSGSQELGATVRRVASHT